MRNFHIFKHRIYKFCPLYCIFGTFKNFLSRTNIIFFLDIGICKFCLSSLCSVYSDIFKEISKIKDKLKKRDSKIFHIFKHANFVRDI